MSVFFRLVVCSPGLDPDFNLDPDFFGNQVSDELASEPVALECPRTGRTLVCYAERIAVVGGERYLVAFPKVGLSHTAGAPSQSRLFMIFLLTAAVLTMLPRDHAARSHPLWFG